MRTPSASSAGSRTAESRGTSPRRIASVAGRRREGHRTHRRRRGEREHEVAVVHDQASVAMVRTLRTRAAPPGIPRNCRADSTCTGRIASEQAQVAAARAGVHQVVADQSTDGRCTHRGRGRRQTVHLAACRGNRPPAAVERVRGDTVEPGEQAAVGMEEGLDREATRRGLDDAVLADQHVECVAWHADHRPGRLLAGEPARPVARRASLRDALEKGAPRCGGRIGEQAQRAQRVAATTAASQHRDADHARLEVGQVDESPAAATAAHRARDRPRAPVVARLHVVVHRPIGGRPVEHEAAQRARPTELQGQPLASTACASPSPGVAVARRRPGRRGEIRGQHERGRARQQARRRSDARTHAIGHGRAERRDANWSSASQPAPPCPAV